ncbi:MAG: hypothetical protein SWY16_07950 [Cyanobacteriota bacterium]|nr:hypothetical protein [Cyanobacteriota bacterium]
MPGILTVVTEEVETILDIYKETSDTGGLNRLKPKLIDYVMTKIQTDRSMRQYLHQPRTCAKFPNRSLELRLKVENYARSGFQQLLHRAVDGSPRTSGRTLLA